MSIRKPNLFIFVLFAFVAQCAAVYIYFHHLDLGDFAPAAMADEPAAISHAGFPAAAGNPATRTARVIRVIDGDTIEADFGSLIERVRLIGIDTPETVDPEKPVQCFGPEASAETNRLLSGKTVELESDPSQAVRDKYGRILSYVFLDGVDTSELLIQEGYAREYTYRTAYKFQQEFKKAQSEAREGQKGLWSPEGCNGGY